jgi:predicted DsbA family dithiol-disulfide isomerase
VNTLDHLAEIKGISRDQAEQMTQYAAQAAKEAGLEFRFNDAKVANSFNAHRLIQMAGISKSGSEAEEQLFKAHFTEGKNIDDKEVLVQIGVSIGLEAKAVEEALSSDAYAAAVRQDEAAARSFGIRGVPYFVFNDKYAVSGAQSTETFSGALQQSWNEFEKENKLVILQEGASCSTDGDCN